LKLFKTISIALIILLCLLMPIILYAFNLGQVLFVREHMLALLEQKVLSNVVLQSMAVDMLHDLDREKFARGDYDVSVILEAYQNQPREKRPEILDELTSPGVLSGMVEPAVHSFYTWLGSEEALPPLRLDLRTVKGILFEQSSAIVEMILTAKPDCSEDENEELKAYILLQDIANLSQISKCNPSQEIRSGIVAVGRTYLQSRIMKEIGDWEDISESIPLRAGNLRTIRAMARTTKSFMLKSFLLIPALFFLLLLTAVLIKEKAQAVRLVGWTMMIPALLTAIIALLLLFFPQFLLDLLIRQVGLTSAEQTGVVVQTIGAAVVKDFSKQVLLQTLLMITPGGLLVIAGWLIDRKSMVGDGEFTDDMRIRSDLPSSEMERKDPEDNNG